MSVVIETTKGIFTVDLYIEQRPKVCKNFLKLCKLKFYNYHLFHSVQPNFIAQTGDPTGLGKNGGESIYRRLYGDQATFFEGDLLPKIKHTKRGTLSMVTVGNNLFGSQFFITLAENLDYLDGSHCVFGEVVEGLDEIVQKFNETICDGDHRPYQDIRITHTVVLDDPFDDPPGLQYPDRSPEPTAEMLASTRIGADEDLDDYDGMTESEIAEMLAEREAKAQATILEMIGDLPDADCAPPENVLFVCKLNPVTNDDDLEIIFSRFGKVKSCEVIRDRKTGDSLQYAFVEFEDPKSCEAAYFKMDNVLIDDRRIHVDFSQSVSKFKWKGKGRLEIMDDTPDTKIVSKNFHKPNRQYRNDNSRNQGNGRAGMEKDRQEPLDRKKYNSNDRKHESWDRSKERQNDRHRDRSNERQKDRSMDRQKERKRSRSRDRQNDMKRSESKDRLKDRQKERKRSVSRDRSRDRKRSVSKDRLKDRQKDRKRSVSRDRQKDRKRSVSRDRQKDRKRSVSRDRQKDRRKSRSRDRQTDKYARQKDVSEDRQEKHKKKKKDRKADTSSDSDQSPKVSRKHKSKRHKSRSQSPIRSHKKSRDYR